jgi:SAM-dependent methyltransferase
MPDPDPPQGQLPPGVTHGLWQYTHADQIADDYDDYFASNKLFVFDEQVLLRHFHRLPGRAAVVADLGCGTGRALVPLARRGFQGIAIDLSEHMLRIAQRKAAAENLPIRCLRANLVELECLADDCVDYVMCLFSTLGMIRGRRNRLRVLEHVRRILRPDGVFILHAHNYWYNLYDPGGPWWLLKNLFRAMLDPEIERGDNFFPYRGLTDMYLHVFTHSELRRDIKQAGFRIRELIPLDAERIRALRWPWLLGRLRANGWIVICTSAGKSS